MKLYHHIYQLNPLQTLNAQSAKTPRKGALICVENQGERGYADLHPWPELWDDSLDSILKSSRHPLLLASVENAKADLQARQSNVTLLQDSDRVESHFLCTQINDHNIESSLQALSQADNGYKKAKIKCGAHLESELLFLEKAADVFAGVLRLDFNSSLTFLEYKDFAGKFSHKLKDRIEFVEDPCRFNNSDWSELNRILPLACDFTSVEGLKLHSWPFSYRVIKPSRMKSADIQMWRDLKIPVVITSSMSHGLDILQSLAVASKFADQTHGLQTFDLYQRDEISSSFMAAGSHIKGIQVGAGLGYTSVLERFDWKQFTES